MAAIKKSKLSASKRAQPQKPIPAKTEPVSVHKITGSGSQSNGYSRPFLSGDWKTNTGIFLLLVIVTLILYSGALQLDFFSVDDEGYVTKNPWITKINFQNLSHILTKPYFSNFSPVHLLSYMLDYSFAGADPFVFHLSSNIWAGITGGFVFLVALALTGRHVIAIPAAILFVVHPAHVEAVAWISSRKDLVATAFALSSFLAYLKYRQGGPSSKRWYVISIVLFLFAVAGKVSVAVFPAVFLAMDVFVEKRLFSKSVIDKIPYLFSAAAVTWVVYVAQPLSGNTPDPAVFSAAFGQSLWLLSGFGKYVIYRLRPEVGGMGIEIAASLFLIAMFAAPLLLRRRFPLVMVMIYWILLGLLPAQLLSFIHPVSDRYLFFPSVAVAILIAWGVVGATERLGSKGVALSMPLLFILALFWGRNTLSYLTEWLDPRSVWFMAIEKSKDPDIPYSLGGHYMDVAGKLGASPRGTPLSKVDAERIANAIWKGHPKLPYLLSEWAEGKRSGSAEKEFQNDLQKMAWENYELALKTLGTHVLPHLYFKRGIVLLDRGDLQGARKEILAAVDETSRSSVADIREELLVSSHNALGAIAWKDGDYRQALKWYQQTEEEQTRFGGNWIPDISSKRQRMDNAVAMLSGAAATDKTDDPEMAYQLGLSYQKAAEQLGNAARQNFSKEKSEQMAMDIWKENNQLPVLLSEWEKGLHGGPAETALKTYLGKLAWESFDRSLRAKGSLVMPSLYFRRGMLLGQSGDLQGARREFQAALSEAAKEKDLNVQHEMMVVSHDALGVIAWTSRDYKDALHWFKIAEEEQKRFAGNWVPDITSKRQRMEEMIRSNAGK